MIRIKFFPFNKGSLLNNRLPYMRDVKEKGFSTA